MLQNSSPEEDVITMLRNVAKYPPNDSIKFRKASVFSSTAVRSSYQGFWINFLCGVYVNLLKPTGHVMHHKFNIQQLYVLLTLYLCVLYLSENKQRLVPLTA
jgi:hypothetical protein